MSKVFDISDRYKQRVYELEQCKGCESFITGGESFTEVILPDAFIDDKVTHIALCEDCSKIAREHGAFN